MSVKIKRLLQFQKEVAKVKKNKTVKINLKITPDILRWCVDEFAYYLEEGNDWNNLDAKILFCYLKSKIKEKNFEGEKSPSHNLIQHKPLRQPKEIF